MRTLQAIMIRLLSIVLLTSLAGAAAAESDWVRCGNVGKSSCLEGG